MKTKKTVIAVFAAVLLISAALIVGCIDQIDTDGISGKNSANNLIIPEGKGVVRIKFVNSNAKTILPVPDLGDYTYDLLITRDDGAEEPVNETDKDIDYFTSGDGASIALPPATDYKISLIAKNDDGVTVGGWNNDDAVFEIEEGVLQELVAELKPFQDGQGTFTYDITPVVTGTTTFEILDSDGDSIANTYYGAVNNSETPVFPIDVSSNEADTITLDSGFYTVIITATDDSGGKHYQVVQYKHVLHIYNGLDSALVQDLSGITLAQDRFEVDLDFSHAVSEEVTTVYEGKPYTDVPYASFIASRGLPNLPGGYTFEGFYKGYSSGTFSGKWNFDTDRVTKDLTLYAKTIEPGGDGSLAITVKFEIADKGEQISGPAAPVSMAGIISGSHPLVLTAPEELTDNIEWTVVAGEPLPSITYNNVPHARLVFNQSSGPELVHFVNDFVVINLYGEDEDGTPYSASVKIDLTHDEH